MKMFGVALGLAPPWEVTSVRSDRDASRLETALDFPRGSSFACPVEGCARSACPAHGAVE
ncbi:MAG: hypothetical protein ACP5VR_13595 [Acidimicrobiales bacterium]